MAKPDKTDADPQAELHKQLEAMDDAQLKQAAADRGINIDLAADRPAIIALIVADDEKKQVAARLAQAEADEAAAFAREATPNQIGAAIGKLARAFCASVPQEMGSGAFEPAPGDERFGGAVAAPDGTYRHGGGEFLYKVRKQRLVSVTRATAANNWGGDKVQIVHG